MDNNNKIIKAPSASIQRFSRQLAITKKLLTARRGGGSTINFANVRVGDKLPSKSLTVTQEFINQYADISGDYNSVHIDIEGMKANTLFGGSTIAHGTINVEPILQAICAIQGVGWPVEGSTIDLQFRGPIRPRETITSNLVVKKKKAIGGKNILACEMTISTSRGNCVIGVTEIIIP